MKKVLFLSLAVLAGIPCLAMAEEPARTARGLTESEQLGITAGTALACNVGSQLDDFELIASRIMANKSVTAAEEKQSYQTYAEAKLKAYKEQKATPQLSCGQVRDSFSRLPIFRSIVYADGSVKMYDGSMLYPRRSVQQPAPSKKR